MRATGGIRRIFALAALPVAFVVALPGVAAAEPVVPDPNLRVSVHDLVVGRAVLTIDLSQAIVPLKEEVFAGGKVTVRISADVLFDFGEATLTMAARQEIGVLATRLRAASGTVLVAGYTDGIGSPASNLTLSQRRADAVKAELTKHTGGGFSIVAAGHGEANPVAPNTKDGKDYSAGRAKNRRVEITFTKN
jgi:outer membrane protein OmpA-like peptidoglycan-associated protein